MYHFWACFHENPWACFQNEVWMATSGDKIVQLCTTEAKATYTGLYAYSDGFAEAW